MNRCDDIVAYTVRQLTEIYVIYVEGSYRSQREIPQGQVWIVLVVPMPEMLYFTTLANIVSQMIS